MADESRLQVVNGERLRVVRGQLGWTRSQLAEWVGCSEPTVGRWERGEGDSIGLRLLVELLELVYVHELAEARAAEVTRQLAIAAAGAGGMSGRTARQRRRLHQSWRQLLRVARVSCGRCGGPLAVVPFPRPSAPVASCPWCWATLPGLRVVIREDAA